MAEVYRLLVADDDSDLRHLLRRTLTHEGFEVETASDGREAVRMLEADPERFDVLISDLRMPEKNGAQLLLEARRISPKLHVIIVSGCSETDHYIHLLKRGAFAYIMKPFKIPDLLDIIEQALEGTVVP